MPINTMKVTEGASGNHRVNYNPRTPPKPTEKLQRLVFPLIERRNISLNALDVFDPRPSVFDLLEFMDRGEEYLYNMSHN